MLHMHTYLPDETEVRFATSDSAHGPMGRARSLDPGAWRTRRKFISDILKTGTRLAVAAGLEHGNTIESAGEGPDPLYIGGADGLFTRSLDVPLLITHKDCVPIFVYGAGLQGSMVGIVHAGWRGVLGPMEGGPILPKAIRFAWTRYGIAPADLSVFLGPAIQQCHFEVRGDVAETFSRYCHDCVRSASAASCFVSLQKILMAQAHAAGVNFVEPSEDCTYCKTKPDTGKYVYFSHRRETHEKHERGEADQNASRPVNGTSMISVIVRTQGRKE